MRDLLNAFRPNRAVSKTAMLIIGAFWALAGLLVWMTMRPVVLPGPGDVFGALGKLWTEDGLGSELIVSFKLNVQALAWSAAISLGLAYLSVLPVMRPLVAFVSKLRFLSLVGLNIVFTLMLAGGHQLKLSLLVFAITGFFVTSMADVVASIPKERFDHARTIGMSNWRVVWEVVVLGTRDQAMDVFRQNAAMGWMMLTMVEGLVRSEGGIGTALLNQNKHFHLDAIGAIVFLMVFVGVIQDYLIGAAKNLLCPYARLKLERK